MLPVGGFGGRGAPPPPNAPLVSGRRERSRASEASRGGATAQGHASTGHINQYRAPTFERHAGPLVTQSRALETLAGTHVPPSRALESHAGTLVAPARPSRWDVRSRLKDPCA